MVRNVINPKWIDERREEIQAVSKRDQLQPFPSIILSWNKAVQWLITSLAEAGLTPKVEQLGAGVKRISVVGQCCPTCGRKD